MGEMGLKDSVGKVPGTNSLSSLCSGRIPASSVFNVIKSFLDYIFKIPPNSICFNIFFFKFTRENPPLVDEIGAGKRLNERGSGLQRSFRKCI